MICDRCGEPASHRPNLADKTVPGWQTLCCHHMDLFMATAARSLETVGGAMGFASWLADHDSHCGATGAAPADYFAELLEREEVVEALPEFGGVA